MHIEYFIPRKERHMEANNNHLNNKRKTVQWMVVVVSRCVNKRRLPLEPKNGSKWEKKLAIGISKLMKMKYGYLIVLFRE